VIKTEDGEPGMTTYTADPRVDTYVCGLPAWQQVICRVGVAGFGVWLVGGCLGFREGW
jgi:hypothetical protein